MNAVALLHLRTLLSLVLICVISVGCSERRTTGGALALSEETDQPAEQPQVSKVDDANLRLSHATELARVHFKFEEFDQAEEILTAGLQIQETTDRGKAIRLLEEIRTARKQSRESVASRSAEAEPAERAIVDAPQQSADVVEESSLGLKPAFSDTDDESDPPVEELEPIVVEIPGDGRPVEPVPASDEELSKLIMDARKCVDATVGLALFDEFIERHTLSDEQLERFTPRHEKWKERASEELFRNGTRWVTKEEAEQASEQADELVDQAIEFVRLDNWAEAHSLLTRASLVDQNGIRADFVLGLLHVLADPLPKKAEKHFKTVLARSPGHLSALNNLAVVEVKLKDYSAALNHWREIGETAPSAPVVGQNLGRVIKESAQGKIVLNSRLVSRFAELYSDLTTNGKTKAANNSVGWLLLPPVLPKDEKAPKQPLRHGHLINVGGGTGFAIGDGYFITNKHVIEDERLGRVDATRIVDPNDPDQVRDADTTIVAVAKSKDLALLHCPSLDLPRLALQDGPTLRGSGVLLLGYPLTQHVGIGLKSTQGIVTGLPEPVNDGMLLFDANINPGNSGGPICDQTGTVVAVATVKYFAGYAGGVTSNDVVTFVKSALPDFEFRNPENERELKWSEVDAQVSPSTVRVLVFRESADVGFEADVSQNTPVIHDRSCTVCSGRGIVPCPRGDCHEGTVQTKKRVYHSTQANGQKVYVNKFFPTKCPTCSGRGGVDCRHCSRGVDPSLTASSLLPN
ncbi:MAG: trypsin-like peptidase domain-containing protein [Planctomycetaceae bacterium]|nr:trypsin-like peptidase domain-containing protein [Planctomycetaceae bacterium]